jgi:hypothetical protein
MSTIPPRTSVYAFDAPDADIILIPANSPRRFHVHKSILRVASPVFSVMLSPAPSPITTSGGSDSTESLPEVELAESESILHSLLLFIYPIPNPAISSLDELSALSAAAAKFQMNGVLFSLREALGRPEMIKRDPIKAFAIAARCGFQVETNLAAKATLRVAILDLPFKDALVDVPAPAYHALVQKHRSYECLVKSLTWKLQMAADAACDSCKGMPPRVDTATSGDSTSTDDDDNQHTGPIRTRWGSRPHAQKRATETGNRAFSSLFGSTASTLPNATPASSLFGKSPAPAASTGGDTGNIPGSAADSQAQAAPGAPRTNSNTNSSSSPAPGDYTGTGTGNCGSSSASTSRPNAAPASAFFGKSPVPAASAGSDAGNNLRSAANSQAQAAPGCFFGTLATNPTPTPTPSPTPSDFTSTGTGNRGFSSASTSKPNAAPASSFFSRPSDPVASARGDARSTPGSATDSQARAAPTFFFSTPTPSSNTIPTSSAPSIFGTPTPSSNTNPTSSPPSIFGTLFTQGFTQGVRQCVDSSGGPTGALFGSNTKANWPHFYQRVQEKRGANETLYDIFTLEFMNSINWRPYCNKCDSGRSLQLLNEIMSVKNKIDDL